MHVPEPVVSLAVYPEDAKASAKMAKALHRFTREDPTFRAHVDPRPATPSSAAWASCTSRSTSSASSASTARWSPPGAPQVKYRETITAPGGVRVRRTRSRPAARASTPRSRASWSPADDGEFHFENKVVGGSIPTEYIGACEKGFASSVAEGQYIGAPVQGLKVTLIDGAAHAVDSSDMAFHTACRMAVREFYNQGKPVALEPLMLVSVEGPGEHQGDIIKTLMQRRGVIVGTTEDEGFVRIDANVPLAEMFGYASVLRSATAGKAEFTMEFARYAPAPAEVAADLVKTYQEKRAEGR